jgi:DNA-binding transcriptional regulator YdaS (Cro superfamily)
MNAREWIDAFAARLGVEPPTAEEWSALLDTAGVAAHSSERVAAPVSCWVAARAGVSPVEALELARSVSGESSGAAEDG